MAAKWLLRCDCGVEHDLFALAKMAKFPMEPKVDDTIAARFDERVACAVIALNHFSDDRPIEECRLIFSILREILTRGTK